MNGDQEEGGPSGEGRGETSPSGSDRLPAARWRAVRVVLVAAVLAAAVLTPALVLSGHTGRRTGSSPNHLANSSRHVRLGGPVMARVSAALAKTHAANLQVTYLLTEVPAGGSSSAGGNGQRVSGSGRIGPEYVNVSARLSDGLSVQVAVGPNGMVETGGAGYGNSLPPGATGGSGTAGVSGGSSLSGFVSLVEQALGQREGAIAMLALASPEGFLGVAARDVTAAKETGTSTLNGIPVTDYTLTLDLAQLLSAPGLTADEATTLEQAYALLAGQGLSAQTVKLAIDSSGFVLQAISTTSFTGGGKVTLEGTFTPLPGCTSQVQSSGSPGTSVPPSASGQPVPPVSSSCP